MDAISTLVQNVVFPSPINNQSTWAIPVSQRLRLWGDVPADQQPAAFVVTHRETDEYRGLGLPRRRLEIGIWCYCRTDDISVSGATYLDSMMEAFEGVFYNPQSSSTGENTLNGLVYFCRLEGRVFKDPGDIDYQALMIVPLIVEMP